MVCFESNRMYTSQPRSAGCSQVFKIRSAAAWQHFYQQWFFSGSHCLLLSCLPPHLPSSILSSSSPAFFYPVFLLTCLLLSCLPPHLPSSILSSSSLAFFYPVFLLTCLLLSCLPPHLPSSILSSSSPAFFYPVFLLTCLLLSCLPPHLPSSILSSSSPAFFYPVFLLTCLLLSCLPPHLRLSCTCLILTLSLTAFPLVFLAALFSHHPKERPWLSDSPCHNIIFL